MIKYEQSSTSIKLYGQHAHKSNLIIPDNHIAYMRTWATIRVTGWSWYICKTFILLDTTEPSSADFFLIELSKSHGKVSEFDQDNATISIFYLDLKL